MFIEMNALAPILYCVKLVETYFWTSIAIVSLLAVLVYDRHREARRHRYYHDSHYGSLYGGRHSAYGGRYPDPSHSMLSLNAY